MTFRFQQQISMTDFPKLQDVVEAATRIKGQVVTTPLLPVSTPKSKLGASTFLKLENMQVTGSFKLRGATNALRSLSESAREAGVIAVSTGNHGRGLAYAASQNKIPVVICMGNLVPGVKVDASKALGAEVRIVGKDQVDAQQEADRLVEEKGLNMLSPYDHPDVIAGQGTIGLEIVDQLDEIDTVVVPLSGGGLIAGIAMTVKSLNPQIKVIGVTMERGPAMHLSLQAGKPIPVEELPTLADSLGGDIGLQNQYTFEMVRQWVDETILVSEQEIADAIRFAYLEERLIVEGGASVPLAAQLAGKIKSKGNTVLVLSGRNIDMELHQSIVRGTYQPYA